MSRLHVLAMGCALWVASPACAARHLAPPPAGPALTDPAELVPGDLDAVVRIELGRMREALGAEVTRELQSRIGGDLADPGGARLVAEAVRKADTAWFAFRPGLAPDLTDSVLILRGDFAGLDPERFSATPPWQIPKDLGGGWRRLDRDPPGTRAAPARLYRHVDDLLIFVSEAAIDGTELALERGAPVARVQAPSEGAISGAIRAPALATLVEERAPAAARLLRQARTVSAQVDLTGGGLSGELEIEFREPASAEQAAGATRLLGAALREQGGLEGAIVERVDVSAVGHSLVLRLELDERDLAVIGAVLR